MQGSGVPRKEGAFTGGLFATHWAEPGEGIDLLLPKRYGRA